MVELGDEARRVLDTVEAVTLDEIVDTARRRHSRRRRAWGLSGGAAVAVAAVVAVVVLVLPGTHTAHVVIGPSGTAPPSTSQSLSEAVPPGSFSAGRLTHRISIDAGQLILDALPSRQNPALSAEQAQGTIAEDTYGAWVAMPQDFGLAEVTVADRLNAAAPRYDHRVAWVAFFSQATDISCQFRPSSSGPPGSQPPFFEAVIVDADTGTSVINYQSRGLSVCGGDLTGPNVQLGTKMLSLPWTAVGNEAIHSTQVLPPGQPPPESTSYDWVIRYTKPGCSTGLSTGLSLNNTLNVTVIVPIEPMYCNQATTVTASFGPERIPLSQVLHGPTGAVAIRNGTYIPIQGQPQDNIPGPKLAARLVLPTTRIKVGQSLPAQIVVINNSGAAINVIGCNGIFQVLLVSPTYHPDPAWPACAEPITIPTGTSTYPVAIFAGYNVCSGPCHQLPTGKYQATTFELGNAIPVPPPLPLEVTR